MRNIKGVQVRGKYSLDFKLEVVRLFKNGQNDAGVQVILDCSNHHRWYRDYAHDPQGADELPRRLNHVCR